MNVELLFSFGMRTENLDEYIRLARDFNYTIRYHVRVILDTIHFMISFRSSHLLSQILFPISNIFHF